MHNGDLNCLGGGTVVACGCGGGQLECPPLVSHLDPLHHKPVTPTPVLCADDQEYSEYIYGMPRSVATFSVRRSSVRLRA